MDKTMSLKHQIRILEWFWWIMWHWRLE